VSRLALLVAAGLTVPLAKPSALRAQEPEAAGPPRETLAVTAGTFVSTTDFDPAFLHLAGSFEPRITPVVDFIGEFGVVFTGEDQFANIAPAMRFNLMPTEPATAYLRAGPAVFISSGSLFLAHIGFGADLARATSGPRFELRSYFRPAEPSFDVVELIGSFQFRLEE
jgi:hypothetical protein